MRFTLKQLDYFIAAGEACSILKASDKINVSQPSISAAVSQLEKEFSTQFFIRHHARGLSLTTAGAEFLREAKLYMSRGHALEQMATDLSTAVAGRLEVSCFGPLAPFVIPEFCHRFQALHPQIDIGITEADQNEILNSLRNGATDIAVTYDLELPDDLEFEPLIRLPPYAVVARDHELANCGTLTLAQLSNWPLILMDLPISRDYFLGLFSQQGLKPTLLTRSVQSEVMRGLVGQGYGYGLANVRPINRMSLDGNELVYVSLDIENSDLTLGLLSLGQGKNDVAISDEHDQHGNKLSRAANAFAEHARELLASGHMPGMEALH